MNETFGRPDGFSLVEVLVSLAVLSILLLASFDVLSSSILRTSDAERTTHAVILAESKIAEIRSIGHLQTGSQEGVAPGGYQWRLVVGKLRKLEGLPDLGGDLPLKSLTVEVHWQSGLRRRSIELSTLIFDSGP